MNSFLNAIPLLFVEKLGCDEVFCLGIFFVLLSVGIAYVLYDLCGNYTSMEWAKVAFVFMCFYTTYAWNYIRAHSSESTQLLLFLLCVRALFRLNRETSGKLLRFGKIDEMWLWAGLLCLTKISWVVFLPLLGGAIVYLAWRGKLPPADWRFVAWRAIVLPAGFLCAAVAAVNWIKFGAPWLSGYHQFQMKIALGGPAGSPVGGIDFPEALYGLTFSPQWSLFVSFPPLILALGAWRRFWLKQRDEAAFILVTFVVFLVFYGHLRIWRGEWGYGPRYFLPLLPCLTLPLLYVLERAGRNIRRPSGYLALSAMLACSIFLVFAQWQVNRLAWFFKYQVDTDLLSLKDDDIYRYFHETHFAKINWDYWQARHDLTRIPYYDRIMKGLSEGDKQKFLADVKFYLTHPNLYW